MFHVIFFLIRQLPPKKIAQMWHITRGFGKKMNSEMNFRTENSNVSK